MDWKPATSATYWKTCLYNSIYIYNIYIIYNIYMYNIYIYIYMYNIYNIYILTIPVWSCLLAANYSWPAPWFPTVPTPAAAKWRATDAPMTPPPTMATSHCLSVMGWSTRDLYYWSIWSLCRWGIMARNGSVSKPCTPGEHQNCW